MKKGFARRNQLIVTGLAIMIAVAGYLHFTSENETQLSDTESDNKWLSEEDAQAYILTDDDDSVETVSTSSDDTAETLSEGNYDTEQTEPADNNDGALETASVENGDDAEYADLSAEDLGEDDMALAENTEEKKKDKKGADAQKIEEENNDAKGENETAQVESNAVQAENSAGEAVLVNSTISGDYFSSARLSREQSRAKNEETLMEIINSAQMEEEKKQTAVNNLIHLTEISEMETAAETLLGAKGFLNAIVTMSDDSVDVVVDADGLTKQQLVQIQDIVKRKTKIAAENIVITPVKLEEQQ